MAGNFEDLPILGGKPLEVSPSTDDNTWTLRSPIDVNINLRDPIEYSKHLASNMESGTRAAAAGGYQAVFDMPNNPGVETHNSTRVDLKTGIARRGSAVDFGCYLGFNMRFVASWSMQQMADAMPNVAGLKLDMTEIENRKYSFDLEHSKPIIDFWISEAEKQNFHAPILINGIGRAGMAATEYIALQGQFVHWCHLSTAEEVEHARYMNQNYGEFFSAGVSPYHLTMTRRNAEFQQRWNGARLQPELGSERDADALLEAYNDGDIHILESLHTPCTTERKMYVEKNNPDASKKSEGFISYGVSGIEFVLPVMIAMIKAKQTTYDRVEESLYTQPKRMLGLADDSMNRHTIVDMNPDVIQTSHIESGALNTPFVGWTGGGQVIGFVEEKPQIDIIKAQPRKH